MNPTGIDTVRWAYPGSPVAAREARRRLAAQLQTWQINMPDSEPVLLVAYELVTNAVEHARTGCVLHLALDECRLHISVDDHRPDPHRLPQPGVHDGHGYGLLIVEGLSRHWGVTPHDDGKSVWAILDTDPASRKG